MLVAQLCPTLCESTDCGPPGSSVHGILQARILEWVAITSWQGIEPKSLVYPVLQADCLPAEPSWPIGLNQITEERTHSVSFTSWTSFSLSSGLSVLIYITG
ncbi:unnamed protein product [Rangifer tarandus platyrhynchus]|uniref:Uncharacterized protein n=2 Tax=Rangifer tarandus platyrhynchus TaxID=3082113 RepID=A0AC59YIA0_RANTA|nr:unnamed protein product [Rangifer tarandus platyrhynchus]